MKLLWWILNVFHKVGGQNTGNNKYQAYYIDPRIIVKTIMSREFKLKMQHSFFLLLVKLSTLDSPKKIYAITRGNSFHNFLFKFFSQKKSLISTIDLKDNILRTFGALGISMKREVEKNEIRLRASRLEGTSRALSLTVRSNWKRLIWKKVRNVFKAWIFS